MTGVQTCALPICGAAPSGFGMTIAWDPVNNMLAVGAPFQDQVNGSVEQGLVFFYLVDTNLEATPAQVVVPEAVPASGAAHFGKQVWYTAPGVFRLYQEKLKSDNYVSETTGGV